MKSIGESMPGFKAMNLSRNYDTEKCIICGSLVKFYGDEYKKNCEQCGTWVYMKSKEIHKRKHNIQCWVCMDKGVVEYPVQSEGRVYQHIARCNCPKGVSWPSTIPMLSQCKLAPGEEFIELQNRRLNGKLWRPA